MEEVKHYSMIIQWDLEDKIFGKGLFWNKPFPFAGVLKRIREGTH